MNRTICILAIALPVCVLAPLRPHAAALAPSAEPAAAFVAAADSLARTGGDDALLRFVGENSLLTGAAVASLLDAAFQAAREGDLAAEKERIALAERIARAHIGAGGSAVPGSLLKSYRSWGASQRKTRQRAIDLEAESTNARKAGDLPHAIALLDEARALYEKIGDPHSIAVNWGSMGVARWGTADWDAVLSDYGHALEARRAVEDRILEGRTLNGLGSTYLEKGDHARSIDFYRQAVELRRKTGDATGLGTSLTYLGNVYQRTGRLVDARTQFEEAIPILESLGRADQMVDLHVGLANLASDMGRTQDANQSYRTAIELAASNQLAHKEVAARQNLAINYMREGRYTESLAQYAAIEPLLATNPMPTETVVFHRDRGHTYMVMGELDRARDDLVVCAEKARELDNPLYAIESHINIGYLYRAMGAIDRALASAQQAVELAQTAGDARRYREAIALRADLLRQAGQLDESLASWREALAQDEADQATTAALQDRVSIATVKAVLGDGEGARAELKPLLPEVRAAKQSKLELEIHLAMGHSYERTHPDSAAACYERALRAMESGAAETGGAAVHGGYLSGERRYYYEEIARFYAATYAATRERRWSERAFQTIERAKARGLLELLQARVEQTTTPEEAAVLDEIYSLDPSAADHASRQAALEARYGGLRSARVRQAMGGLAAAPGVVSLNTLEAGIPKKTVMVAYALGDSASLAWVIDRSGCELVRLAPRAAIAAEVRTLRDSIARVKEGRATLLESSRALYRMVLEPVQDRIGRAKTVIIVPDGLLFEVPFEALLSADARPEAPWGEQPFFVRRAAVLYTPSATVYASLKSDARSAEYRRDLLAVGNPDFTGLDTGSDAPLAPLPFAAQEVDAIGTKLKQERRTVLTGPDAGEKALKLQMENAPRVLHLATHGLVDAQEPARSNLAFAPGDGEDGHLYTLEILSVRVPSRLVVMSACESARGQISRGEGVVGLTRAFLASGAGSVVSSLWSVSDESTALLMKTFYDRMFREKDSASRALNEARLALLEDDTYSHPFFWSPFIVTGTERAPW